MITRYNAKGTHGENNYDSITEKAEHQKDEKLSVERLQSLSKLHAYYVSNTKTELKFAVQNMNDDDIYNAMQNIFSDEVELDEIDEEELENFDE
ncbi:4299_t:CDS:2, partial [Entrophospora sp. SA101]